MLVYAVIVAIRRTLRYNAARKQSEAFRHQVVGAFRTDDLDEVLRIAECYDKSPAAMLTAAGLVAFTSAPPALSDSERIEVTNLTLKRSRRTFDSEMTRGISLLATFASLAPLVGFFGTAYGIPGAFRGCAAEKWFCLSALIEGLSDSLVPAALGLFVAVPIFWLHSHLITRMKALAVEMDSSASELMNYLTIQLERNHKSW